MSASLGASAASGSSAGATTVGRNGNHCALTTVERRALEAIEQRGLASVQTPVLLMVSGGSDSTALAYTAHNLAAAGKLGPLAMLHVNHCLRGEAANKDEFFVQKLAQLLEIPLFSCRIDVAALAEAEGGNVEAVARRERYAAALDAVKSLCVHEGVPPVHGCVFTAHSADDRVENFYMRSIVGTGPGGFRSMDYTNTRLVAPALLVRPLLSVGRSELRASIEQRAAAGFPVVRDAQGCLWCEDATNDDTTQFRAFVRKHMVPAAKERNPQLLETLGRTMNIIAEEDDMLQEMADELATRCATPLAGGSALSAASVGLAAPAASTALAESAAPAASPANGEQGVLLAPGLAQQPVPLVRRVIVSVLQAQLPEGARIEQTSVDAVLAAWAGAGTAQAKPRGGYVANIQGNLAVSANKSGVRVEPMAQFRARRKK